MQVMRGENIDRNSDIYIYIYIYIYLSIYIYIYTIHEEELQEDFFQTFDVFFVLNFQFTTLAKASRHAWSPCGQISLKTVILSS